MLDTWSRSPLRGGRPVCGFTPGVEYHDLAVHGDDFTVLAQEQDLDWFWRTTQKRLDCKKRGRLGPEEGDEKSIRILNRIVTWTEEGIMYEGRDMRRSQARP